MLEPVRELKSHPGGPLPAGGATFATDVVGWDQVDEYKFTV
ncbi:MULTISPECIES: hypothetical protein [unclassified Frigoribacterium]|nr:MULTISPECIES: hypothetical protein [unclassified Frigoribacterium]